MEASLVGAVSGWDRAGGAGIVCVRGRERAGERSRSGPGPLGAFHALFEKSGSGGPEPFNDDFPSALKLLDLTNPPPAVLRKMDLSGAAIPMLSIQDV